MRYRAKTLLAPLAAIFIVAATAPASAQPEHKDAKRAASVRFQKAVELYKGGDVRAALIEFRRAYKLAPTYHLLFNIGQASAELRDYVSAYNSFTEYLQTGGDRLSDERREMVEREIVRLKSYLARLDLEISVASAEVTVDGVVVGVSPLNKPLLVSSGRRKVVITREGHARWERSIDLAGEDSVTVKVDLLSLSAPTPLSAPMPPAQKRSEGMGKGFWASATVTLALGIGTGIVGTMTMQAKRDYDDALARVPTTQSAIDDAADKTRRLGLLTDIGIGLTAAGAVTTIIFAARGSSSEREVERGKSLDLVVSPRSIGVVGSF